MKKFGKTDANRRRAFQLESLEERLVLTTFWANDRSVTIPQDSDGFTLSSDSQFPPFSTDFSGIQNPPMHGILHEDGQSWVYVPDPGYVGEDSFTLEDEFRLDIDPELLDQYFPDLDLDSVLPEFEMTVNITVAETLYATPDWIRVAPDSTANPIDVLANDRVLARDETVSQWPFTSQWTPSAWTTSGNDRLQILSASASDGSVEISSNGYSLSYSPTSGFHGPTEIQYTIIDEAGHTSNGVVSVEVDTAAVLETSYTSESEFIHGMINQWMAAYADKIHNQHPFDALRDDALFSRKASTIDAGTSVVEQGDIVKSEGDFLFVASNPEAGEPDDEATGDIPAPATLTILDVSQGDSPQIVDSIEFRHTIEDMFLNNGRLTVITQNSSFRYLHQEHTIHVLEVSNPTRLRIAYQTTIQGNYQASRVIDNHLITVSNWSGGFDQRLDQVVTSPSPYIAALLANGADRFLPTMNIYSGTQDETVRVEEWHEINKQELHTFHDRSVISTFDLAQSNGIPVDLEVTSLTHGQLHVSSDAVYLAGNGKILKYHFEEDGSGIELAASGNFEGELFNDSAINEHDGHVRLVTYCLTDCDSSTFQMKSNIIVMQQSGQSLETVGAINGIANQSLAARFIGDRAYVSSFEADDPFWVIDLSDPRNPIVQAEMTLPGFSQILHTVDEDHFLGIGRNDTIWDNNSQLQISLFNVSNPNHPFIVDQYEFEGGISTNSPLNGFGSTRLATMLSDDNVLTVPVFSSPYYPGLEKLFDGESSAIAVFDIDLANGAIEPLGQVEFVDRALRSRMHDDLLLTISRATIKATPLRQPDDIRSVQSLPDIGSLQVRSLPFVDGPSLDINQDGRVSPVDALMLINHSVEHGYGMMNDFIGVVGMDMLDVNQDLAFSPIDTLMVVNALGGHGTTLESSLTTELKSHDGGSALPSSDIAVSNESSTSAAESRTVTSNHSSNLSGYFLQIDTESVEDDDENDIMEQITDNFADA